MCGRLVWGSELSAVMPCNHRSRGHAGVVEFGCKVLSCSEEPQEEQTPGGGAGSGSTSTVAPFELQISYRSRGSAAAAATSASPEACGQGAAAADAADAAAAPSPAAAVVVARARHVIGADGYFSRVRRTVRCQCLNSDQASVCRAALTAQLVHMLSWVVHVLRP